ncbi:MAG: DUF1007 family protein [Sediminispirochaetaceae bacterium]
MKKTAGRVLLTVVLLFCLSAAPVNAHPHMFIDTEVTFEFDRDSLKGFWVQWYFDVIFTASIRLDYDYDKDGRFNDGEVRDIEQNAFRNLRNFHYFTSVIREDGMVEVEEVRGFDAWLENDQLVYRFFVPYRIPLTAETTRLSLIIFDETFFCDILYREDSPVHIKGGSYAATEANIVANKDYLIEYDPTGGRGRDSSGAQTTSLGRAFPYELRLSFRKK